MAEAFRVGAMPCGMPRTAPEAQHAAADRAPACSFHRFGKDTPGKARVAEKYDASRKTPLRDFAIQKKAGKENNPPRFPKIRPAPSRSVAAKIRRRPPLLQSPSRTFACRAHAESLRRQSPRRANPPVASAESRSRRKLARRAPWRDPGPQRARTATSCGKAAPHDSAVRRARLAASAQKPQARNADARPAPQPRCSSAP